MFQYIRLFMILLALTSTAFAQGGDKGKKDDLNEQFRETAKEMKQAYDNGKLNRVIDLYRGKCCTREFKESPLFKKVEEDIRMDIYRLVALSYDDLDETSMRDKYIKKILDIRPHMESVIYRPSWRRIAREKYIVLPRLMLGVNAGVNITIPHPYRRYSILGPAASTGEDVYRKDYRYKLTHIWGLELAGVMEYTLTKHLSVNMQVSTISLRIYYENNLERKDNGARGGNGSRTSLDSIHRHELYYIEVPVFLKYRFVNVRSRLKPYLQIGGFFRGLQFAHKSIDTVLNGKKETKLLNLEKRIHRIDSGLCFGAGITYDTRFAGFRLFLELEVNYRHGFNNIVNEDQRYENAELIPGYYDVFDDIKLRNWDLTFKILLPISFKTFKR